MDIEKLNQLDFRIPEQMLKRDIPVLFVDERCTTDDLMILKAASGEDFLVSVTLDGIRKIKALP